MVVALSRVSAALGVVVWDPVEGRAGQVLGFVNLISID